MSLPKRNRIPSQEIPRVFARGKKKAIDGIALFFLPNGARASRVSIVVPSHVAKKSTVRNKIRRRTKDVFRALCPLLKKPHDVVVLFKRTIVKREDIQQKIEKGLRDLRADIF